MEKNILYRELSYQIIGAAIEVRKSYGPGLKEIIYQNAYTEELENLKLNYRREAVINIYSPKTGKVVGTYRPDFIIEDKIIIEIKAIGQIPKLFIDQLYGYLKNSKCELGYFINFSSPKLYYKRIIYTNNLKTFLQKNTKH